MYVRTHTCIHSAVRVTAAAAARPATKRRLSEHDDTSAPTLHCKRPKIRYVNWSRISRVHERKARAGSVIGFYVCCMCPRIILYTSCAEEQSKVEASPRRNDCHSPRKYDDCCLRLVF